MATPPPSRSVNTRMAASPLCKSPAAASTTTMWRLVDAPDRRHPLARYPVRACPCADRGVGGVGVWLRLDIDATARSITPKARRKRPATWKKTFGHHLLLVFQDRPEIAGGEVLAGLLRALTAPHHQGAGLARRRDRHGLQADRSRPVTLARRECPAPGRARPRRRHIRQRQTRRTTRRPPSNRSRLKDLHPQVLTIAPPGSWATNSSRTDRATLLSFCQ